MKKQLTKLLETVTGISLDSRMVKPGDLFIAVAGNNVNGVDFINDAINNGAAAILVDSKVDNINILGNKIVAVDNLLTSVNKIAAEFYNNPGHKLSITGVTGTNGKSSIVYLLAKVLPECRMIGTLSSDKHTTPDPLSLQKYLSTAVLDQKLHIALEVSSHALEQSRIFGMNFKSVVFTNLSQDHLDYHANIDQYWQAKKKLFLEYNYDYAIINVDNKYGLELAHELDSKKVICFTTKNINTNLQTISINNMQITSPWGNAKLTTQLVGNFNLQNILAVIAVCCVQNMNLLDVIDKIKNISYIPGRLNVITKINPKIIIDYAHTPDALEQALLAIQNHYNTKSICCVFGCGGARDVGKRRLMGQIAAQYSSAVILTADNPRHENLNNIIADILTGCISTDNVIVEQDRHQAIFKAIQTNCKIILLAGKGHEKYQYIGTKKISHSDFNSAMLALVSNKFNLAKNITGISTDSRTIKFGELFVAIDGDNYKGANFINMALQCGAVYSSQATLASIAAIYRENFLGKIIAITGSCGKTTTKQMLLAILSQSHQVLATKKNFNNHVGVPLTLLSIAKSYDYLILEMGSSASGEITDLMRIAQPDISVITNAKSAHLEGFGSLDGIAESKSEIFTGLGNSGIAVINMDDNYAEYWIKVATDKKIVKFSIKNISAIQLSINKSSFIIDQSNTQITLPIAGLHNIHNALAAIAIARQLNIALVDIKNGLASFTPPLRRLELKPGHSHATIIDDSYNGTPAGMYAAIDVLAQYGGTKILVLGDMLEIGNDAPAVHRSIGAYAVTCGITAMYAVGVLMSHTVQSFGNNAWHFASQADLLAALLPKLNANVVVLVKGSHGSKMFAVADQLTPTPTTIE